MTDSDALERFGRGKAIAGAQLQRVWQLKGSMTKSEASELNARVKRIRKNWR
jgi:hypothetical protein